MWLIEFVPTVRTSPGSTLVQAQFKVAALSTTVENLSVAT